MAHTGPRILFVSCGLACVRVVTRGPGVPQLTLHVDVPKVLDACLAPLRHAPRLASLTIAVGSFILDEAAMTALGELALSDLRLVSHTFRKQALPRPSCSHLDNAGIKAFVDAVCRRCARLAASVRLR